MTKTLQKQVLTDFQRRRYQKRLSHYFKEIKHRNGLQSKDLADSLGYTPPKFSLLESDTKPHGRFINSLDFLAGIASLENMSLFDFISYLEGKADRFLDEKPGDLNRPLYTWEKKMLEAFDVISIKTRREFVDICQNVPKEGKERLELLVKVINALKDKNIDGISSLLETINKLN